MRDGMVPGFVFGASPEPGSPQAHPQPVGPPSGQGNIEGNGRSPGPRVLDLRRTEAPGPGALPVRRAVQPRCHAIRAFDEKGRISDRVLFGELGWHQRMSVSIGVHASGALVVCRDPGSEFTLTERSMVAVPAALLRWCGFGRREQVLLVAVPSLSSLVIYGREMLDRLLPDAERMVVEAGSVGGGAPVSGRSAASVSGAVEADRGSEVAGG